MAPDEGEDGDAAAEIVQLDVIVEIRIESQNQIRPVTGCLLPQ